MTKEKFIRSTIILMIGGLITKLLGMFIRIVMTRMVGLEGIGLYMLVNPTFSLFMTLSQLSMPTAISKIVSEETHRGKNIILSAIPLLLIFNVILILMILCLAPMIANHFLKDPRTLLPILAIALVLPFDSISNLLRGYFFGKQRMFPHVLSHILEQIFRLTMIVIMTPYLLEIDITYAVAGLIFVNMFSEGLSIVVLYFFLPKKVKLTKEDLHPNQNLTKEVLNIAIPTTGGRLVGSIGYFLEPILLTSTLLFVGYTNDFIVTEYGIVSGYVMPILLLPGFFTGAISNALLPAITKAYHEKKYQYVKKKTKQAILLSLMIGIPFTIILILFPNFFLSTLYHTNHGATYLRIIAPVFLLFYIQSPLASTMQAINGAKWMMWDNIIGIVIRLSTLVFTSLLKIGMFPLLIATSASIITTTFLHYKHIKKALAN